MARHFRQPGIVSTCNKFVMANETNCTPKTNPWVFQGRAEH
mgnify:CR=1 FL=1